VLALIVLAGLTGPNEARADDFALEYRVTIGEQLNRVVIELCFTETNMPAALVAPDALSKSIGDISAILADGTTTKLRIRNRTIELAYAGLRCVGYSVWVAAVEDGGSRMGHAAHSGAVAVNLDQILLRPRTQRRWHRTRISFIVPPVVHASAPGSVMSTGGTGLSFEFLDRPVDWTGNIVFGRLTESLIETGGARIRLSIVGDTSEETAATLHAWVAAGVDTITTLYGHFPVNDLQVLVFPLGRSADPVPWGEVVRGGGDSVHLYVDATRSVTELNDDWVLAHELSHLIHPYVSAADSWLAEGIASYFQNVLRARAGMIEAKVAWQKLDAGFKRGMAQFTSDRTLARDTRAMMREHQYMRVYWSGAAIALIGDLTLRQRSAGAVSLDTVFKELSRCCLPSRRRWRARDLMAKLDEIAGFEVFIPLYERYVVQPVFPELKATYRRLGLSENSSALVISDDPAARSLRAEIMGQQTPGPRY